MNEDGSILLHERGDMHRELSLQEIETVEQKLTRKKFAKLIGKKPIKRDLRNKTGGIRFTEPNGTSIEYIEEGEEARIEDVHDESIIENQNFVSDKDQLLRAAIANPLAVTRELCKRDLSEFIKYFWLVLSHEPLVWNWHLSYICDTLMQIAKNVSENIPQESYTIINVPPVTTKTMSCSIMFPVWCWTNWPWMKFICASYGSQLSLTIADKSRDLIRSKTFHSVFPDLMIKEDKDTKAHYRLQYLDKDGIRHLGGDRYSTSVGGTLTGFHGHILIVDDPLKPDEAASTLTLETTNNWISQTLSTRKVDVKITPTILIMQRLHQNDPSGYMLEREKNIRHICLPGEIIRFAKYVRPVELIEKYVDGMLDLNRLSMEALAKHEVGLGQYGYANQIGQNPAPPGGGMFKVDNFSIINEPPTKSHIIMTVRYWDKAGSAGKGAYTAGVKACRLADNKIIIMDVKRGQWATEERERIIRQTAEADGNDVIVYHEQEPGSGGKDSAQATIRNLIGFTSYADRPTGDKTFRADPYSVQVNNGNVMLLRGDWNHEFIEEHRFFPFGRFKDQVDAMSGAMARLAAKRLVRRVI